MKQKDKLAVISRYNERLTKYGYDPRTLGWFKARQPVRFRVLSEIGDLDNCSILDVGCGFGDLYGFLVNIGLNAKYTGYDINPNLIKIAKEKHPSVCFEVKDILTDEINQKFDYVLSSGVFNFKLSDNKSFIQNMFKKMFEISTKGVAVDFMSSYVDFENEDAYYANPEEIFSYCKTLSRRVTLRHDYMPFEFAVYIYKDNRINKRNVFAEFDEDLDAQ